MTRLFLSQKLATLSHVSTFSMSAQQPHISILSPPISPLSYHLVGV